MALKLGISGKPVDDNPTFRALAFYQHKGPGRVTTDRSMLLVQSALSIREKRGHSDEHTRRNHDRGSLDSISGRRQILGRVRGDVRVWCGSWRESADRTQSRCIRRDALWAGG